MFRQHYATDDLDAALLLIPIMGFLPPDDDRVKTTVLAIADELTEDGLVLRYRTEATDTGFAGKEGTFTICSFWLVTALAMIGEDDRARDLCEKLLSFAGSPAPLRRGDRRHHRAAPRELPAGLHPPGPDRGGVHAHRGRGRGACDPLTGARHQSRPHAKPIPNDKETLMSLKGKVAIVTGGNTGIGKSVVLALAGEGANIVIDWIFDEQATEELEKQVVGLGDRVTAVQADVSKVADLQRLVDAAVSTFGRLDIMVNNAGVETRTSVLDTTEAQYEKVLDINLKSAFFGTQLAAKQMIAQGDGGRIINMTSVHEDWPMPNNTAYCLSKGGMRMLTRTAGVELAPHNVLVVGVGPGAVDTPINKVTKDDPVALQKLDTAIPIGRMAEPSEIGSVVAFLAGPGASYLTATTVFADGGIMQSSPGL